MIGIRGNGSGSGNKVNLAPEKDPGFFDVRGEIPEISYVVIVMCVFQRGEIGIGQRVLVRLK